MEKKQTEVFKKFVESKQRKVSDVICLLDECADKLELLEDYFLFRTGEDVDFDETMAKGLAGILGNIRDDIRLISADLMIDVDKHVAEFRKNQKEKKEEIQVNA